MIIQGRLAFVFMTLFVATNYLLGLNKVNVYILHCQQQYQQSASVETIEAVTRNREASASKSKVREHSGDDYESLLRSRTPIPGEKTLGLYQKLYSGFRNEAMAFQAFVMYATENNFTQILLPSVWWKDLFGTNKGVRHEELFDVDYWNTFHPTLPRFVEYNETLFPDFDGNQNRFKEKGAETNATQPYAFGRYPRLVARYRSHLKKVESGNKQQTPAALAMQKALRPHPDMRKIQDKLTKKNRNVKNGSYMALHARVEPDMQKHTVCTDKKVLRLRDILDSIERQFEKPTVDTLFIAINRPMLEKEANDVDNNNNTIAVDNLAVLNQVREEGLWNGTVQVFEAGMPSVRESRFGDYPGISGAMMDFYLALEADIFIGTEVSSFSSELVTTRFYRSNFESYYYRPDGLVAAVNKADSAPPKFGC